MPIHPNSHTASLRIIDASFNRAAEGLRVVEDYARFVQNNPYLSQLTKEARHDLANLVLGSGLHARGPNSPGSSIGGPALASIQKKMPTKPLGTPWTAAELHGARETLSDVGTQFTLPDESHRGTSLSV